MLQSSLGSYGSPSRQNLSQFNAGDYRFNEQTMSAHGNLSPLDDKFITDNQKEDTCWICEGWVEADFRLDLLANLPGEEIVERRGPDDAIIPERCFVHCDFDQWEPDLMNDEAYANSKLRGHFQMYRMLP